MAVWEIPVGEIMVHMSLISLPSLLKDLCDSFIVVISKRHFRDSGMNDKVSNSYSTIW